MTEPNYRVCSHPKVADTGTARVPGFYGAWRHPDGRWLDIGPGRMTEAEARFDCEYSALEAEIECVLVDGVYDDPN